MKSMAIDKLDRKGEGEDPIEVHLCIADSLSEV